MIFPEYHKVTLKVMYMDKNGKRVKTELQTIEQFPSGYQRYVLFQPNFVNIQMLN